MPAPRLLAVKQVQDRTTLSRATIYRLERDGKFPRLVSLGAGRVAWLESEVEGWVTAQVAARDAASLDGTLAEAGASA
nr:AlpA family transcriptional regulator [Azospirillum soli]